LEQSYFKKVLANFAFKNNLKKLGFMFKNQLLTPISKSIWNFKMRLKAML
jgi:hypothetical protein